MKIRLLAVVLALAATSLARAAEPGRRPNVILIVADDMGFSDLGCYGSEIATPNIDALAKSGVRVAQFYNMARCCPTRASLMTGLYPHQAGVGFMNDDLGHPAYRGELNDRCATVAEVLRDTAGYRTAMSGKWHLSHLTISEPGVRAKKLLNFEEEAEISPRGKGSWPVNRGFEEHFGTIPGVENFYDPYGLVHNETPIRPEKGKPFHYTDFITEHALEAIDKFSQGDRPFFLYVAHTAPHWPMHASEEDIAPYSETYKVGWDKIREERLERQVKLGLVKADQKLSPRNSERRFNDGPSSLSSWEEAPHKEWQARRMAVYAGMISHLDDGVGKIMARLKEKKLDENTVVIFLSDNGACAENVKPGWYDIPNKTRDGRLIQVGNDPAVMPGGEQTYQSYGPVWANASNTPFRRFKHYAEEGGISAPFIVHYPGHIKNAGGIDHATVGHVIDVMPTILDLAGAAYPKEYKGRALTAVEGKSLVPALAAGQSLPDRPLCWEHEGNRAARMGKYKLVAGHNEPWKLYDLSTDRTEMNDLSAKMPEKVRELTALYEQWAQRCEVQPWPVRKRS